MASQPPQWIRTFTTRSYRQVEAERPRVKKRRARRSVHDAPNEEPLVASHEVVVSRKPSIVLTHKPSCPETRFAAYFVDIGERGNLFCSWMNLVPMRLGNDPAVDAAAVGMVKAINYAVQKHLTGNASTTTILASHLRAISTLRTSLDSPTPSSKVNALVAALLIQTLEWSLEPLGQNSISHAKGIVAIMTTDPPIELSEATRTILYFVWHSKFGIPVSLGLPSRFEANRWLEAEPAGHTTLPPFMSKLAMLHNQLFIRLPRLIAVVRELRRHDDTVVPKARQMKLRAARKLADELYSLQNQHAESESLHDVSIRKTMLPQDILVTRYSFHFRALDHFSAMLLYWQTRIIAGRLYLHLHRRHSIPGESKPDLEKVAAENVRIATNIIMSWEFAINNSAIGFHALRIGFIAVWAVTMDVAVWSKTLTITQLRRWLLQCYNELHIVRKITYSHEDLDEAAELLVGGPLSGFLTTGQ